MGSPRWALIAGLLDVAATVPKVDLQVIPDFLDAGVSGEARGAVRVFPLQVLPPLLAFGLSPVTLRAVRTLRSGRS